MEAQSEKLVQKQEDLLEINFFSILILTYFLTTCSIINVKTFGGRKTSGSIVCHSLIRPKRSPGKQKLILVV